MSASSDGVAHAELSGSWSSGEERGNSGRAARVNLAVVIPRVGFLNEVEEFLIGVFCNATLYDWYPYR